MDRLTLYAVSNWWLLGQDYKELTVSEMTYNWMWGNVQLTSESPKLILRHWGTAHQYFDHMLGNIQGDYNIQTKQIDNQDEIDQREKERIRFLEFHIALGGLLLYRENYKAIKGILKYTQSVPAYYYLLPNSMFTVFFWFTHFKGGYVADREPTEFKYPFPELDNLGESPKITFYISQYIALLFIRQFFVAENYTNRGSSEQPILPNKVSDLLKWESSLEYFKFCLKEVLRNRELLRIINYDIEGATNFNYEEFTELLRVRIEKQINHQRISAELSVEKVSNFKIQSAQLISTALDYYSRIWNENNISGASDSIRSVVRGTTRLMPKTAFTDGDIPHLNYDSIIAQMVISEEVNFIIPNSFLIASTRKYLIEIDEIDKAIEMLNYDPRTDLLVGVNFPEHYLINQALKFEKVVQLPSRHQRNVLFVLPKSDLPQIAYNDISLAEKESLELELTNEEKFIYTSVIDLTDPNKAEHLEKWKQNPQQNPDQSVQLTIAFIAQIIWKQEREVVQLNFVSPYAEQGIKDEVKKIKPLNRKVEKEQSVK